MRGCARIHRKAGLPHNTKTVEVIATVLKGVAVLVASWRLAEGARRRLGARIER